MRQRRQATGDPPMRTQRDRRRDRERAGRRAEWLAAWSLRLKGYRVLAERARTYAGEIDIVAIRGHRLAFVEVKHRRRPQGHDELVGARQAGRLHRAAAAWLKSHPKYLGARVAFDRVDVIGRWQLRHRPDALQPGN